MFDMSNTLKNLSAVILGACIMSGCAVKPKYTGYVQDTAIPMHDVTPFDSVSVRDGLYRIYREWENVRYVRGGLSRDGIDCSGFVYMTYRDVFGMHIPRTTKEQSKIGESVLLKNLKSGDIILFKTGIFQKHVGIYMENNIFMHASKSNGITLSNLSDQFWSKRYWQSRRIFRPILLKSTIPD